MDDKESVDNDIRTRYFYTPVRYLQWGGVSIYDIKNPTLFYLHKIYSYILLGIFGYGYMLGEILHIIKHFDELEEVTLTCCYLIAHFMAVGKIILVTFMKKSVIKFLCTLEQDDFLPSFERGGEIEQSFINKAVLQTNMQAKIFGGTVFMMIITKVTPFLFKPTQYIFNKATNSSIPVTIFPYPCTFPLPLDFSQSPYYELMFFYQTFSISLFGLYLGTIDIILTGLIIHVTAQFKIITNAILTVTERAKRMEKQVNLTKREVSSNNLEVFEERFSNFLKLCINDCIRHHYGVLELVESMECTFNLILLVLFLGTLLSLCVGLYQTSLVSITNPTFISMTSFSIAIIFQFLIYSYNGNELTVNSLEVAKAAFNCKWLQSDRDVKRSLILIILRAQKASYLTAGKFTKISLETFMSVVRGGVSYFMVLRTMNEDLESENF